MVEGKVDMYFYISKNGLKRWDTCAPEALMRAWGGLCTDLNGKEYKYDENLPYPCENGIIATFDKEKYENTIKIWKTI